MDLDRSLLEMIDEYVSDALAATGTRRAPRPTQQTQTVDEPEPEAEALDLEPQTEPFAPNLTAQDAGRGGAILIDEETADALLSLVAQQLAHGESAPPPMSRARAPRSTADLDEEITNIVKRPPPKP